ncbi:MBL fold metallo-hydrolase [uncultured Sphingomonas sp.]|uniref:MBL fold metallo-hydrolase n=2 Tax=Sphingomonas TaxID=13687 RepID=UPI0035C99F6D
MNKISAVFLSFLALPAAGRPPHVPYSDMPILSTNVTKVSDHVWEITGFPNVAIVVGTNAVLVVDTGMGPTNGATVARVVATLAPKNSKLFLTTTHYHPEHVAGEPGFPPGTILIRNAVQQRELDKDGQAITDVFRSISEEDKKLLAGVVLRVPDITFDQEVSIDLGGGVKARLLWLGGAHTAGDELTLVEPDHTLISGDVVQNKTIPYIFGHDSTPTEWLSTLDKVAKLNVSHVLPDHSAPGDGSLVGLERELVGGIRTRALSLKRQGISVDATQRNINAALKQQHPDWPETDASEFVKSIYADPADPR